RNVKPQHAAIFVAPAIVEVQDDRQDARVIVTETIEVSRIAGARRINRVVALELEQCKLQLTIDRKAQRLERVVKRLFARVIGCLFQPANPIASDTGALNSVGTTSDGSRKERARAFESKGVCPQGSDDTPIEKFRRNGIAPRCDHVDHARYRVSAGDRARI